MLNKCDLIWFDVQIEERVATLRGNFFVGYNLGHNVYKIGILCLIGIAHLPESMNYLKHTDQLELRPCLSTDIGSEVDFLVKSAPSDAAPILNNLIYSLKLIASKVLPNLPISGNVRFDDQWDPIEDIFTMNGKIKLPQPKDLEMEFNAM